MPKKETLYCALAGLCAGAVTGLFGGGGGLVLVPLLTRLKLLEEEEIFPASVCIIGPICVISLLLRMNAGPLPWSRALVYLPGSAAGGILAGLLGKKLPTVWLHRALGLLILLGGGRYLWQSF